jgi:hypothetical protein
MRLIHPKPSLMAALLAAVWFVCAGGCRNQTSGLPNPFLAPDRVPPPATRALLPGQAQPYYPGDPLPVMHSSAAPSGAPGTTSNSPAVTQFTSTDGLNWNAPGGGSAGSGDPRTTDDPRTTGVASSDPRTTGVGTLANNSAPHSNPRSNEPAVAIPSDGDSLRFALPSPEPVAIAPTAMSAPAASAPQPMHLAAAPSDPSVVPASYSAPTLSGQQATTVAPLGATSPPSTGPWRAPQIGPEISATFGVPTVSISQPNRMDVRLRAVPSPPPEPVEPTTPRIRIPSYAEPPTATGASTLSQPAAIYATSSVPGPVLQTVQISPIAPPSVSMAMNSSAPQTVAASGDGFRPRSSGR